MIHRNKPYNSDICASCLKSVCVSKLYVSNENLKTKTTKNHHHQKYKKPNKSTNQPNRKENKTKPKQLLDCFPMETMSKNYIDGRVST